MDAIIGIVFSKSSGIFGILRNSPCPAAEIATGLCPLPMVDRTSAERKGEWVEPSNPVRGPDPRGFARLQTLTGRPSPGRRGAFYTDAHTARQM